MREENLPVPEEEIQDGYNRFKSYADDMRPNLPRSIKIGD
jgi:hypothetical protein